MKVVRLGVASLLSLCAVPAQIGGAISGVVVDPAGGVIPNAQVTVLGNGITAPLFTNAEGRFVSSGLPAGEYQIRVSSPGFKDAARNAVRVKAGSETPLGQILLAVAIPACDPGPKLTLEPIASAAAEITGVVEVSGFGNPAGVSVTLIGTRSKRPVRSTLSDSSGKFGLTDVQPGTYRLIAHLDGYADFLVDSVDAKRGFETRLHWALFLGACRSTRQCTPTREFPPLICL